eukprot:2965259-Pyramimonas_sp.AAC.1
MKHQSAAGTYVEYAHFTESQSTERHNVRAIVYKQNIRKRHVLFICGVPSLALDAATCSRTSQPINIPALKRPAVTTSDRNAGSF